MHTGNIPSAAADAARPVWRRNQHVTVATVFVVFTAFAFVIPFLPLYVRALGVHDEAAAALWSGVLIGVSPLLAGLLAPVWGRVADRRGHKRVMLRVLVTYALIMALSAVVTSVGQLFVLRVLVGVFGGIGPLGLAMATALAPREETGRAVGLVQSAQILSAALGPFLGGLLADAIGIPATFLVAAAVCAAAGAAVAGTYVEVRGGPPTTSAATTAAGSSLTFANALRLPGVPLLLVSLFLVNFVGRSLTPLLPHYLEDLGAPSGRLALATGLLIAVYSLAAALSAAGLGRLAARHSPQALLAAGLLGGALTVAPMALAPGLATAFALVLLLGLSSGGALTLCYTIGGLAVPGQQRATAFGYFSAAALFGGAISPSVAGLLARFHPRAIFWVDGALFLFLAALAARAALRPVSAPA